MTREFANFHDVKEGVTLVADGDFTCMREGEELRVMRHDGVLFVACSHGFHALHGQLNEQNQLVGLYLKEHEKTS